MIAQIIGKRLKKITERSSRVEEENSNKEGKIEMK